MGWLENLLGTGDYDRNFMQEEQANQYDYNSWNVNSGYSNKNDFVKTIVVNAETSIVNGELVVTIPGKSNSEPDFMSVTKNFGGGLYDAGKSAVSGIWDMSRHPIDTAENLGKAVLHPIDTAAKIWEGLSTSFEEDVINGNYNTRAHFAGRAIGEVGVGILGTKGLDKAVKVVRGGETIAETANFIKGSGNAIEIRSVESLPQEAKNMLGKYEANGWQGNVSGQTPGTPAGSMYGNKNGILPSADTSGNSIIYREFDVNNKIPGQSRGLERFVEGSDGSVYYTNDHYKTFTKIE